MNYVNDMNKFIRKMPRCNLKIYLSSLPKYVRVEYIKLEDDGTINYTISFPKFNTELAREYQRFYLKQFHEDLQAKVFNDSGNDSWLLRY